MTPRRWTPKSAVARSRRNISGAIERMRAVALEWEDIDQSIIDRAEDLIRDIDAFGLDIAREIDERLAAGEHVGL